MKHELPPFIRVPDAVLPAGPTPWINLPHELRIHVDGTELIKRVLGPEFAACFHQRHDMFQCKADIRTVRGMLSCFDTEHRGRLSDAITKFCTLICAHESLLFLEYPNDPDIPQPDAAGILE